MPQRPTRGFSDKAAGISALAVLFLMLFIVFGAAFYQKWMLERRYKQGPWTEAVIDKVWVNSSPKGHPDIKYYLADVEFQNIVDGRVRQCVGVANLGVDSMLRPGERLRIAPLRGTCGDIATQFD